MRLVMTITLFTVLVSVQLPAQINGWQQQKSNTGQWLHGVDFIDSHVGWAVGESGTILKSTDDGAIWTFQNSSTIDPLRSVCFINADTGWVAGGCDGCSDGVILKTTDGGESWSVKDEGRDVACIQFTSALRGWAVGDGLVMQSTDGGESWTQQTIEGVDSWFESVCFVSDSIGWIGGYLPGTVLSTTDAGSHWQPQGSGIDVNDGVNGMYFLNRDTGWIAGFGFNDTGAVGFVRRTTDGGVTWTPQLTTPDLSFLSLAFTDGQHGWVVGSQGAIFSTTSAGLAWSAETSATDLQLDQIDARPGAGGWTVGLNGVILRKNFGTLKIRGTVPAAHNWNMISIPIVVGDSRKSLLFPQASSQAFQYGVSTGYQVSDVLENGKGYWLRFNDPQDVDIAGYALDTLSVSLQAGWNMVGGIGVDVPVSQIQQDPPGSVRAVFGYNTSYYTSTTVEAGRGYWFKANQDCQLTFKPGSMLARAGGSFINPDKLDKGVIPPPPPGGYSEQEERRDLPSSYALMQNYPNPFNPQTRIRFDLPEPGSVHLSIYTVLGQEIARLADGDMDAGQQSVLWNSRDDAGRPVPSGVYFYRIRISSSVSDKQFSEVRKLLLLR